MQIWKASLVLSLDENEHWKVFFNFKQAKGDYFEWEGKYSQREYVKRGSKWVVDSIPANITVSKQYSTYKAIKGFDHELSQQELTEIEQELKEAIVLATKYHDGQVDKSKQPYILHPLFVMSTVKDIKEKIVAVLHDIIEDTELTEEDLIIHGFDFDIVQAIVAITKVKGETYHEYLNRVKCNELATTVKLADLTHNMDLTRIENPTTKDYQRLEKYKKAYQFLSDK